MNIYDNDVPLAVLRLDVHTIELIVGCLLVAFAFQDVDDRNWFTDKHGKEALKYSKIRLLTKQALDSPVKTYIFIFQFFHHFSSFLFFISFDSLHHFLCLFHRHDRTDGKTEFLSVYPLGDGITLRRPLLITFLLMRGNRIVNERLDAMG